MLFGRENHFDDHVISNMNKVFTKNASIICRPQVWNNLYQGRTI